ncbi:superinfection immunity protein [Leptospira andrefontaineae]|uniref:Superinfection immunity protein n=1 Tax=Leptospira andrefontaineae TaxID=2484976 RepID=A0A4R9GXR4_9LEPT|nr:superinfection immunity protein [Leptospira andrefontaineae]
MFLLPFIGMYFLPSIVAIVKKKNLILIPVLNLFLGWTVIGWIILLFLSVKKPKVD